MWGLIDRNRIIYELQVTEGKIREIDFRIMELKRYKASILGKFFFTDFDRMEIARIDSRIAELEYMKEELKRRVNHLRLLLSRY